MGIVEVVWGGHEMELWGNRWNFVVIERIMSAIHQKQHVERHKFDSLKGPEIYKHFVS